MTDHYESEEYGQAADRWLDEHQRSLVDGLDAVLEAGAGLSEIMQQFRHDALVDGLDAVLDVEAGLSAIVPAGAPSTSDAQPQMTSTEEDFPERLLAESGTWAIQSGKAMRDGNDDRLARVGDLPGVAERIVHALQELDRNDLERVIAQLNELHSEVKVHLLEVMCERNLLSRRLADASKSERELMQLAAAAIARRNENEADVPLMTEQALRRALRLRKHMEVWRVELQEADEAVRLSRAFDAVLQESRADLEWALERLGGRSRVAETRRTLARIADRLRTIDSTGTGRPD
ncbi:PspA/IM30 family protein [Streptomyces sp. SD31]|uniref:PspA/IM30 family protein n=1 Tax=Streptomyces sp. SD31 TaxID=3452208 RepID=UPI003F8B7585